MASAEAEKRLSVSRRTLHRMVEDGRLPIVQKLPGQNGAYLFAEDDIDRIAGELAAELEDRLARLHAAPSGPAEMAS